VLKKEKRMSKKVTVEIEVQQVIDAVQEAFNGPDAQEIADELFERVVDKIESNLDLSALVMELNIGDIAMEIDIRELAEHIELDELAERLADNMQRKLLKDWNVKETVETVVERMLSAQLGDMRVSIARLDLERRTLCSEIESLKATLSALQPLLKLVEALKS
jgi:nitrogen regulatory protein PII